MATTTKPAAKKPTPTFDVHAKTPMGPWKVEGTDLDARATCELVEALENEAHDVRVFRVGETTRISALTVLRLVFGEEVAL